MTNIERANAKRDKEVQEIESWLIKISQLRLNYRDHNNYIEISKVLDRAERCITYETLYWDKVNDIVSEIFEKYD